MKKISYICLILLYALSLKAQNLQYRIDSLFQTHINKGEIHGCIAYVFQKDKPLMFKTYGYMDLENKFEMDKNTIFRLASMSKILTSVAALTLLEEGKFGLDDPVKIYIPEFADLKVLSPQCTDENNLVTEPLVRDVTVLDLCRHTAGFGYGGNDIVGRLNAKNYREGMNLKEFAISLTRAPLKYQPGSRWEYSFSTDILGYFIEVVSGKPLNEYMEEAIFKPLGMTSTGFYVPADKLYRLSNFYEYSGSKLILLEKAETSDLKELPAFLGGGGGCVSTVRDYSAFCQMLLNYGEYKGKRILKPETVDLLLTNQIAGIIDRGFEVDGFSFGVGVSSSKESKYCWWSGSPYNNTFIIDFNKQTIAILLMQNGPWRHLNLMNKFKTIVNDETM